MLAVSSKQTTKLGRKQDTAHIIGAHILLKRSYLQLIISRFMLSLCWLCGSRHSFVFCVVARPLFPSVVE